MEKHFFIIQTHDINGEAHNVYISDTFEDIERHISDYSDWYCPWGTCTVIEVDTEFKILHSWRYVEGYCKKNNLLW